MSVNKVFLVGRVGQDPQMRGQGKACAFSVATSTPTKEGNTTEWHNCVCFFKTAKAVMDYVKKGSLVCCEGRIETSKYKGKDGVEKQRVQVLCDRVTFLGGKPQSIVSAAKAASATKMREEDPGLAYDDWTGSRERQSNQAAFKFEAEQPQVKDVAFEDDEVPW